MSLCKICGKETDMPFHTRSGIPPEACDAAIKEIQHYLSHSPSSRRVGAYVAAACRAVSDRENAELRIENDRIEEVIATQRNERERDMRLHAKIATENAELKKENAALRELIDELAL